jgi:hypothetical protein
VKPRGATLVLLAAVVAAALLVPPAAVAATRQEYIAQADPICQATEAAERHAIGPVGAIQRLIERGRLKAAGKRLRNEFGAFSRGVEQLATIQPPDADAQLIGAWVENLRAQVPLGYRAARALIHGRIPNKLFGRLGSLNRRTQALVADYGFQSCDSL